MLCGRCREQIHVRCVSIADRPAAIATHCSSWLSRTDGFDVTYRGSEPVGLRPLLAFGGRGILRQGRTPFVLDGGSARR